jgi:Anti-sigma-K factor rskA/Sigma-70, region 4
MSPVDTLDATQRAVLQLVLKQGKGYDEIADLLGIEVSAVRDRAHAALDALGPSTAGLTAGRRADIADYLLGQQSSEDRDATREHLEGSAAGRAWARSVAGELRPLARNGLPEIPSEARRREPRRPDRDEADEADGGEPLRATPARRSSRTGGILLLAGLAAIIAVVVILIVSGGDDSSTTKTASSNTRPATQPSQTGPQPTPVAQINLKAADGSNAVGIAQVLAQGNQRLLAVLGQRLPPSTKSAAYAVWLYTSAAKAKLLGFVDPPVGKSGKFQNVINLPTNAAQYRELVVTREKGNAKQPGEIVLRGQLQLS